LICYHSINSQITTWAKGLFANTVLRTDGFDNIFSVRGKPPVWLRERILQEFTNLVREYWRLEKDE